MEMAARRNIQQEKFFTTEKLKCFHVYDKLHKFSFFLFSLWLSRRLFPLPETLKLFLRNAMQVVISNFECFLNEIFISHRYFFLSAFLSLSHSLFLSRGNLIR